MHRGRIKFDNIYFNSGYVLVTYYIVLVLWRIAILRLQLRVGIWADRKLVEIDASPVS